MRRVLIVDCSFMCYRSFHVMRHSNLTHKGMSTAVLYGFFKDVAYQIERHGTNVVAFCFDRGKPLRAVDCRTYKSTRQKKRQEYTKTERLEYEQLKQHLKDIRVKYLPDIGFSNIYSQPGYEADDMIALACQAITQMNERHPTEGVILSADQDMYQLLSPLVSMHNPTTGKTITNDTFAKTYGIDPSLWANVKAIAGCNSDDVEGIKGVGNKTAIKFLVGALKSSSVAFRAITDNNKVWRKNMPLVKLPYAGAEPVRLRKDNVCPKAWKQFCTRFGFRSLAMSPPILHNERKSIHVKRQR